MARQQIRFGIIGLGLMGREFASAASRWCHLLDDGPVPIITAVCNRSPGPLKWFCENVPSIKLSTQDYRELFYIGILTEKIRKWNFFNKLKRYPRNVMLKFVFWCIICGQGLNIYAAYPYK